MAFVCMDAKALKDGCPRGRLILAGSDILISSSMARLTLQTRKAQPLAARKSDFLNLQNCMQV